MELERVENRISKVVEGCETYWSLSGVPRASIDEMKSELEQHLREATAEGKTVEAVTGSDIDSFANSWARENQATRSPGWLLLDWAAALTGSAAAILAMQHIFFLSPSIPVSWMTFVSVLLPATGMILLSSRKILASLTSVRSGWKRELFEFTVAILFIALPIILSVYVLSVAPTPLFVWPWPATLLLAVLSVSTLTFRRTPTEARVSWISIIVGAAFVALASLAIFLFAPSVGITGFAITVFSYILVYSVGGLIAGRLARSWGGLNGVLAAVAGLLLGRFMSNTLGMYIVVNVLTDLGNGPPGDAVNVPTGSAMGMAFGWGGVVIALLGGYLGGRLGERSSPAA